MNITRREALGTIAVFPWAMTLSGNGAGAGAPMNAGDEGSGVNMCPLDYSLSFLCNTAEFNAVRFWVESRTRIIDEKKGSWTEYYQCGSCKSENTFAERNLFMEDNYDFLPIWGGGRWLIFRRPAGLSDRYRTVYPPEKLWGEPLVKLREAPMAAVLETWEAIRDATASGTPLVAQTEIADAKTRLRAVLEYPVKTMNVSLEKRLYQVDTGPVAFPDLSKRYDPPIESLRLAFVAFNAADFADFVVEQETPVSASEPAASFRTYHYSKPFSVSAKNRLFGVGEKRNSGDT